MPSRSHQTTKKGGNRGFASMDADKQRAIASAGGRAAHQSGNAHEFDTEEAREAGRRGGLARSKGQGTPQQASRAQSGAESATGERRAGHSHGPGRDDGRSGRKGQGSMRTSDNPRTDTGDDNTRTGRGKHH